MQMNNYGMREPALWSERCLHTLELKQISLIDSSVFFFLYYFYTFQNQPKLAQLPIKQAQ